MIGDPNGHARHHDPEGGWFSRERALVLVLLAAFIAVVGGLELFGSAGIVLGPVTLALTVALVEIWRRRTAGGRTAETGVNA